VFRLTVSLTELYCRYGFVKLTVDSNILLRLPYISLCFLSCF